jgi:hypothetical protein
MFYKFTLTGTKADWGFGISQPENVQSISNSIFALRPDGDLTQVENPTVVITALTDEEVTSLKEEHTIPADWVPEAINPE